MASQQSIVSTMSGKTCLVTGATAGIGEVAARELARAGACVIVVGRSEERCKAVVASIVRETGNPSVEHLVADLSSQAEVRRMAAEFLRRHDRLHVLVNNAGAMFALRQESVDGFEMTVALNHNAYFLLTNLLLDTLKKSAPSRIVIVSSGAHADIKSFNFNDPQAAHTSGLAGYGRSEFSSLLAGLLVPWKHPGFVQYAQSKLANLLFAYELARRLQGTGVSVNALHPGFVKTKFTSGNGSYGRLLRMWVALLGISAEEGAKTIVYLAASPEVEGVTGKYFVKQRPAESSAASHDVAAAEKLWRLSEEWTAQIPNRS